MPTALEVQSVKLTPFAHGVIVQNDTVTQVAITAEIVEDCVEFHSSSGDHLQPLGYHLRAYAVAADELLLDMASLFTRFQPPPRPCIQPIRYRHTARPDSVAAHIRLPAPHR